MEYLIQVITWFCASRFQKTASRHLYIWSVHLLCRFCRCFEHSLRQVVYCWCAQRHALHSPVTNVILVMVPMMSRLPALDIARTLQSPKDVCAYNTTALSDISFIYFENFKRMAGLAAELIRPTGLLRFIWVKLRELGFNIALSYCHSCSNIKASEF